MMIIGKIIVVVVLKCEESCGGYFWIDCLEEKFVFVKCFYIILKDVNVFVVEVLEVVV